jgi:hypothetical protein
MRRILFALSLIAVPALAAEKADDAQIKGGPPGTNVEMPYLMAPMNDGDGKLAAYAYISTRLTAGSPAAALQVRDKLAFIQDAFVRDVNSASVAATGDLTGVDIAAVESRLTADARRIIGTPNVKMVTVCTVQVAPLHAREAPRLADATDLADPKAIPKSRCEGEKADKPEKAG